MRKVSKNKPKRVIIVVLTLFLVVRLYFSSTSLILDAGGETFKANISNCSYYAVEKCIQEKFDFSKACQIQKDDSGNVVFIQSDALLLNYFASKLSLFCYDYMKDALSKGFFVPIGSFTGIKAISGMGEKVCVKLNTALSVDCKIVRSFVSAGINQTRQTFSLVINTEIKVFAPFYKKGYEGKVEVVLFDNLIIGKVPQTYLDSVVVASGSVKK